MFEGFSDEMVQTPEVKIHVRHGGSGPPLLLLHGFPQCGVMWHKVAPALAERFTVVVADLRGYGDSEAPHGDPEHRAYSKRQMAADMVAVMQQLGHERFRLAGHDRGGRVSYRLALDHPERVERLALLDIMTTYDTWEAMDWRRAIGSYHWSLLAQPEPVPETLIGPNKAFWLGRLLRSWAGDDVAFTPEALAEYERCFDDATVHATCEDYRAGATIDYEIDKADKGNRQIQCPVLVLPGSRNRGTPEPYINAWRPWVAGDLDVKLMPCGHFIPEEAPEAMLEAFGAFF